MSTRRFTRFMAVTALLLGAGTATLVRAAEVDPTTVSVVDVAAASGVNIGATPTWDICKGDWDGDGSDDFAVTRHMKYSGVLETQAGGSFTQILPNVIMPKTVSKPGEPKHTGVDRHACVMADFDRNGETDMYATAGRYASNRVKTDPIDNELWMQQADGSVFDMALTYGVNEPCHRSRFAAAPDLTGDGWPELVVAAQVERSDSTDPCNKRADYPYIEQSHVYVNLGDQNGDGVWDGFRFAPEFNVSVASFGSRALKVWDQNNDGRPDLIGLPLPNRKPLLMRNNGSSFTEVSQTTGIKLPVMNGFAIGDVTVDGRDDLVYADASGFFYRAGTSTGVSTLSVRIGTLPSNADGWNVAIGDADGDGDMDIFGQTSAASGVTVNPDDVLYLNDGTGMTFTPMAVPSAGGASNDVETINVNGLAEFVVTNGGNEEKEQFGPVQLIAVTSSGSSLN